MHIRASRPLAGWTTHRVVIALVLLVGLAGVGLRAQGPSPSGPRLWDDHRSDIEAQLRTADVVKMDDVDVGVTQPRRAFVAPGGLVESFTWKPIKPGRYNGYWESYKSEIAAYELDKLLNLDMIPPVVERTIRGDVGAAVFWISNTKSFKQLGGVPRPPPSHVDHWNEQLVRAKMIDNLMANIDSNQGNWLVDPAWNVMLIDHTRAFTSSQKMVHEMTRISRDLWTRMQALDEKSLSAALGTWLNSSEIHSVLTRRDQMNDIVEKLVAKRGDAAVFLR